MNFWDLLLRAHGTLTPYYLGKWRVTSALAPLASESWDRPRRVKRNGVWFELDLHNLVPRQMYYDHVYEPWETNFVRKCVSPGCVAFDCGSHIGYFALLMADLVGPTGQVHAFEASPTIYAKLLYNINLNRFTNITAVNIGVSDGRDSLQLVEQDSGTHLTCTSGAIPTVALDEYVIENDIKRLDFIKADVEGFEMRLLHGAENVVSRFRPTMLVEINPGTLRRCGSSADEVVLWMSNHGYIVRRATWHGLVPFSIGDISDYANVIAIPQYQGR